MIPHEDAMFAPKLILLFLIGQLFVLRSSLTRATRVARSNLWSLEVAQAKGFIHKAISSTKHWWQWHHQFLGILIVKMLELGNSCFWLVALRNYAEFKPSDDWALPAANHELTFPEGTGDTFDLAWSG